MSSCALAQTTFTNIHHAGGLARNVPVYLVNTALPNLVQFSGVEVAESVLPPGLDVVIGMDIITRGDFAVTNRGRKTTFSFRIPSQADIDFVKDDNAANQKAFVLQRQSKPSEQRRQANRRKRRKKGK